MKNHMGQTPGTWQPSRGTARSSLQAGAKHSATNDGYLTPLHTVCRSGDVGTVGVLVEAGADQDARDVLDRQPMYVIGCHRVSSLPALLSTASRHISSQWASTCLLLLIRTCGDT